MHRHFLHLVTTLCFLILAVLNIYGQMPRSVFIDSLKSDHLNEMRQLKIEVPNSPDKNKKFPVILLLDGETLFDQLQIVQHNYEGGFTPPSILVSVINGRDRTLNLTPTKMTQRQGSAFNQDSGGAKAFRAFIKEELLPYLEQNYPASSYRTLIGHSYAGLFTIDTLLEDPALFDNYLAIDPSMDWDNQVTLNKAQAQLTNYEGIGVFASLGGVMHMQDPSITLENVMEDTSDYTAFARANVAFSQLMSSLPGSEGFRWDFYEDELHGTISLPSIMHGLKHLFEWYRIENVTLFNDPETPTATVVEMLTKRADKLEEHFGFAEPPLEEDLLNILGYMHSSWGNTATAEAIFVIATSYYPNSANTWDSLAEFYEGQQAWQKALVAQRKAVALSEDVYFSKRLQAIKKKEAVKD